MSNLLKDLHQDHIHFSKLLAILTDKVTLLRNNRIPNFYLMLDVVDYLENYADLYHHPREDSIYSFYLKHSDSAKPLIAEAMQEHRELKVITSHLRRAIDGILQGDIIPKDQFIEQLAAFIERQQDHLNAEETSLFPVLAKALSAEDWRRIEKLIPARQDPLFGEHVERQYQNLYQRIVAS